MNPYLLLSSIITVLLSGGMLFGTQADTTNGRPEQVRVAVLELDAPDIPTSGRAILTDLVRHELLKGPGITLIDRAHIREVMSEQGLHDIGVISESTLIRAGQLIGAEKIVTGRIGNLGELFMITLQMLDVETGSVDRLVEESYLGPMEKLTVPIRASVQQLLGIGGEKTLKTTKLRVTSKPPGASIYLNDLFEGSSPLTMRILDGEKQELRLSAPGYATWEQDIEIDVGETNFVDAELIELIGADSSIDPSQWQDGRKILLGYASLYTIWLIDGSFAAFGVEESRPYIGGLYVGGPIGFFTTLNLTRNKPMTISRTAMIVTSSLWGSMWGISAASMLDATEPEPFFALSLLGGNLALYQSVKYTSKHNISGTRVMLTNLGSFLGTLLGLGVPYLLNVEDENIYMATLIGGGLGGAYYAFNLTKRFDETLPAYSSRRRSSSGHRSLFSHLAVIPVVGRNHYFGIQLLLQ